MQKEIFDKVAGLIAVNNDIVVETITIDTTFEQLHMDSLAGDHAYKLSISSTKFMHGHLLGETSAKGAVNIALSNSFAFGGLNAVIAFKKWN